MRYLILLPLLFVITLATTKEDDLVNHDELLAKIQVPYSGFMYSGYLAATDDEINQFHYYLLTTTSTAHPTAPIILWLNGGPGCSSLQGAFNENGPFVFKVNTDKFEENPFAWTNFANMLYLESPAKVGYSYGNAEVDDDDVAKQNLHALIDFFTRFPELQENEFYISGESYAGVYIPTLANEIIIHNRDATGQQFKINLKGVAIGNGCTHPTECSYASENYPFHVIDFLGRHSILSEEQYSQFINLQASGKCDDQWDLDQSCIDFTDTLIDYLQAPHGFLFNPYNVYGICWNQKFASRDTMLHNKLFKQNEEFGGCNDARGLYAYFRDADWNRLTHISDKSAIWYKCTNNPEFKYTRLDKQTYYLYEDLIKSGLRIMHFSGDIDAVVPLTGTLYWVNLLQKELRLATLENWRPWYVPATRINDKPQNAGNVWTLEGLTLVTVRNAGHMVPTDRRPEALVMIQNFVENKPLPKRQ